MGARTDRFDESRFGDLESMMKFPPSYLEEVQALLGEEELQDYLQAMTEPVRQGLRVNTAKASADAVLDALECRDQEKVPWCPAGYYIPQREEPLSHSPYYYAGLYYLQEPSAMAPASILPIEEGDRVLDLCAAPGGKSTALAAKLGSSGLLVANDISPSRARALLKNVEMFGSSRVVVTSEAPYRLAQAFPGFFNKILVDAPCSGEGMFRKDPSIMKNWEQYGSAYYAQLQKEILHFVPQMLCEGGMLVYSTCTYSPLENEQQIEAFLDENPEFELVCFPHVGGMMDGRPDWGTTGRKELAGTAHFWPHRVNGEGHFAALLRKGKGQTGAGKEPGGTGGAFQRAVSEDAFLRLSRSAASSLRQWAKEALKEDICDILPTDSRVCLSGTNVYAMLLNEEDLTGLRVLRPGLLLGTIEHERFEPSQALAMTLRPESVRQYLALDEETACRYLKGETLENVNADGWTLAGVGPYPLGWGKAAGGRLKNKYLKSWRMMR